MKKIIGLFLMVLILAPFLLAESDTTTSTATSTATAGSPTNTVTIDNSGGGAGSASSGSSSGTEKHLVGESLSYSAPAYSGAKGVSTSQMGGIFGSLTLSDTEVHEVEYTRQFIVESYLKANLIPLDQAKAQAQSALKNLEFASTPRRFLGFGWKTNGKSLENLFGILSFTSFRGNTSKVKEPDEPKKDAVL